MDCYREDVIAFQTCHDTLAPQVRASGKWLYAGDERLLLRGVTYGTFGISLDGGFPSTAQVEQDFAQMVSAGVNAARTYIPPPLWLLELAHAAGLRVMVDLAWEQHVAFLDDAGRADAIEDRVREQVRSCAGHPAILSTPSATRSRRRSCAGTAPRRPSASL